MFLSSWSRSSCSCSAPVLAYHWNTGKSLFRWEVQVHPHNIVSIGPVNWMWGALTPLTPPPPARPPTPRPARPPAQHVAETRFRDSSRPPVRNRSTCGWGWGGRESRARPSLPVSIRYTRYGVGIRVKPWHRSEPAKLFIIPSIYLFIILILPLSL